MNIRELRNRIADKGTDGLAAEVRKSNDDKYGEGNRAPLTDAELATVNHYRRQNGEQELRRGESVEIDTLVGRRTLHA